MSLAIWPRPDLSLVGFSQTRKIAAATPNYVLMEGQATVLDDLVDHPLRVDGGYISVPERLGIGLSVREEIVNQFPYRLHRIAPTLRDDGSVAH